MKIIYAPHKSHKKEGVFADAMIAGLHHALHIEQIPRVKPEYLDVKISTAELRERLCSDTMLTPRCREKALRALSALPSQVKVAESIWKISCDIAIEHQGATYYYEFHEQQHRTLSVGGRTPVYDANNVRFDAPRYLQRLIRDIWRVKALPNFTIVWFDWFAVNKNNYCVKPKSGFWEYSLSNNFSFKEFCGKTIPRT